MPERAVILAIALTSLSQQVSADALRDPTQPTRTVPVATPVAVSKLKVSAVFVSAARRVAIVNGQRVREGDTVAGATVSKIEAGKVSFVRQGNTLVVPLLSGVTRN